jgi:hypothetical protein
MMGEARMAKAAYLVVRFDVELDFLASEGSYSAITDQQSVLSLSFLTV